MTFRPTVLEAAPAMRLRWPGHLLLPGPSTDRRTLPAFQQMDPALRRRAEQPQP